MTKENFINKWAFVYNVNDTTNPYFIDDLDAVIANEIAKTKEVQQAPNVLNEQFSEVHHKIVDGLGTILSSFGANLAIMSIVMSWGDTQDSVSTLETLNDYIERYIDKQPDQVTDQVTDQVQNAKPFDKNRYEAMFRAVVASGEYMNIVEEIEQAEIYLTKLDAYYAEKEKGGANE